MGVTPKPPQNSGGGYRKSNRVGDNKVVFFMEKVISVNPIKLEDFQKLWAKFQKSPKSLVFSDYKNLIYMSQKLLKSGEITEDFAKEVSSTVQVYMN